MFHSRTVAFLCAALGMSSIVSSALAGTVTVDLSNPGTISCGTSWQVRAATFEVVKIPANHACTGSCFPGSDNDELWLYPSALMATFTGVTGVTGVEIDLVEADPSLTATAALFYNNGQSSSVEVSSTATGIQTLSLVADGFDAEGVLVYCCECSVAEMRFTGETIVESGTDGWSAIKALY